MYYHVSIKTMFSKNIYYMKNVHIMMLCEKKQNQNWEQNMRVLYVLRESTSSCNFYLNFKYTCVLGCKYIILFSKYILGC